MENIHMKIHMKHMRPADQTMVAIRLRKVNAKSTTVTARAQPCRGNASVFARRASPVARLVQHVEGDLAHFEFAAFDMRTQQALRLVGPAFLDR